MTTPSESTPSFLERNKDFVLKLRLVGVGGAPQIRRVKLPRIAEGSKISFDALVRVAISYTFPNAPTTLPQDYDVVMTYYDVDNDCITIATTDELVDAIEQYQEKLVLRVTTDVKMKKNRSTPKSSPNTTQDRGLNLSSPPPPPPQNPIQEDNAAETMHNVLESFVSAVGAAVNTIQTHANAGSVASSVTVPTNIEVKEEDIAKEVVENIATEPPKKEEEPQPPARPFIHGRHTCDGCLCTPIVGDRYHATNLPDYDLCSKCFDNYKGTEIQFSKNELDRDRPFQERWHRKRERWANRKACHHGGRRGRRGGRCPARAVPNMDNALKEAIRRSLADVKVQETTEVKTKDVATETLPPKVDAPAAKNAPEAAKVEQKEEPVSVTVKEEPALQAIPPAVAPTVETFNADEEDAKLPAKDPPAAIEEQKEAAEPKPEVIVPDVAPIEPEVVVPPVPIEPEVVVSSNVIPNEPEVVVPAGVIPSDIVPDVVASTPEVVVSATVPNQVAEEEPLREREESFFSSDAEGSGDVAAELGQTLDQCARAINDMMSELDRNGANGQSIIDESDDGESEDEDEWQVVGENQVEGDAMLARAAQMIGSALFEKDLSQSVDMVSSENLANSQTSEDNFSVPSSVPTEAEEHSSKTVPSAVSARWAAHLRQLHELGFFEDVKNVDILERLTAANIGAELDDEVSVEQVVNELLGHN